MAGRIDQQRWNSWTRVAEVAVWLACMQSQTSQTLDCPRCGFLDLSSHTTTTMTLPWIDETLFSVIYRPFFGANSKSCCAFFSSDVRLFLRKPVNESVQGSWQVRRCLKASTLGSLWFVSSMRSNGRNLMALWNFCCKSFLIVVLLDWRIHGARGSCTNTWTPKSLGCWRTRSHQLNLIACRPSLQRATNSTRRPASAQFLH